MVGQRQGYHGHVCSANLKSTAIIIVLLLDAIVIPLKMAVGEMPTGTGFHRTVQCESSSGGGGLRATAGGSLVAGGCLLIREAR